MENPDETQIQGEELPPPGGEQPAATGSVSAVHTPATEDQKELADQAREMKSYRLDDVERRPVTVFHYNLDGTFTPVAAEFPPGVRDIQEAFSYWGFQSAGGVNLGTSWIDTLRLPMGSNATPDYSELLQGSRAVALVHWDDGYESVVTLDSESDISRAQTAFRTMSRGVGGLDASFDAQRNAVSQPTESVPE